MELVLSLLALIIALIAMWVGSTSLRKSDGDMTAFLLSARKELSATKSDINQKVREMDLRVTTLDQLVAAMKMESTNSSRSLLKLEKEVVNLRDDLDALDESIPKQYRHPSSRTNSPQVHQ